MKIVGFITYLVLQIAFIPLAIIGVVITGYKQIAVSKRLGVSQTAIEIINGRWTMHVFGIRQDAATAALIAVLPNTSVLGLWLVLFPLWLQTKISGQLSFYPRIPESGKEVISDLVPARTLYFDRIIERAIRDVDQIVFMGAGYDTRAYGILADADLAIFELDQSILQLHKREMLRKSNIRTDHVTFVSVDFSKDDMFEKLSVAGFDASKKTLFLWEGVTLYLSLDEVLQTMKLVKQRSIPGSILLADIYGDRMIKALGRSKAGGKVLELTDEGLGFGLSFMTNWQQELSDFIEAQSMSVGDTHFLGSHSKKGPYAVVVEILC